MAERTDGGANARPTIGKKWRPPPIRLARAPSPGPPGGGQLLSAPPISQGGRRACAIGRRGGGAKTVRMIGRRTPPMPRYGGPHAPFARLYPAYRMRRWRGLASGNRPDEDPPIACSSAAAHSGDRLIDQPRRDALTRMGADGSRWDRVSWRRILIPACRSAARPHDTARGRIAMYREPPEGTTAISDARGALMAGLRPPPEGRGDTTGMASIIRCRYRVLGAHWIPQCSDSGATPRLWCIFFWRQVLLFWREVAFHFLSNRRGVPTECRPLPQFRFPVYFALGFQETFGETGLPPLGL